MTYGELIDELTYRSYAYNRLRSPDISPERWSKIYGDTKLMEIKFHNEVRK